MVAGTTSYHYRFVVADCATIVPVETVGAALAAVTHFGVGQADDGCAIGNHDPFRCGALPDLRLAICGSL